MSTQQPPDDGTTDPPSLEAVAGQVTANTRVSVRKPPPPEKPSDVRRRSYIILSFWLIVLCLGLPIWWKTTTIYRADLPLQEMLEWADGKVCASFKPSFIDAGSRAC
jgi:phosphatidylinositol glycan class S